MKNRTPKTQRLVRFEGVEDLGSVVSAGIEVISEDHEMQVEFASVRNSVGSESEPVAGREKLALEPSINDGVSRSIYGHEPPWHP